MDLRVHRLTVRSVLLGQVKGSFEHIYVSHMVHWSSEATCLPSKGVSY